MTSISRERRGVVCLRGISSIWLFFLFLVGSGTAFEICDNAQFFSKNNCTVVTKALFIRDNQNLPSAGTLEQIDDSLIVDNWSGEISFPLLKNIGHDILSSPAIIIKFSPDLNKLSLPNLQSLKTNYKIAALISGRNGTLPIDEETINMLNQKSGGKSVDMECVQKQPFKDDEDIYCTRIYGDFSLENYKKGPAVLYPIRHISGCLNIVNAVDDLRLLANLNKNEPSHCGGVSTIQNSEKCHTVDQLKSVMDNFGKPINYIPHETCEIVCTMDSFINFEFCNIFKGDVVIKNLQNNTDLAKFIKRVKNIHGKLIITGNNEKIIVFPKLKNFFYNGPGPAIEVYGNKDLESLKMKELNVSSSTISVRDSNLQFEEREKFSLGNFSIECHFGAAKIKTFTELDFCTSIKGDLVLDGTNGSVNIKTQIKSISGCLKIKNMKFDNLDFLDFSKKVPTKNCSQGVGGTSEFKNNSVVCLKWSHIKGFRTIASEYKTFNSSDRRYENCSFPCTQREFLEDGSVCRTMIGDLKIDSTFDKKKIGLITQRVVEIKGSLNVVDPQVEDLAFPNLKSIAQQLPLHEAAFTIIIQRQLKLKMLSFPKLEQISPIFSSAVHIKAEKLPFITEDLDRILRRAAPQDKITYECSPGDYINDWSQLHWCTAITRNLIFAREIRGTPSSSRIELIHGCLNIERTNLQSLFFLNLIEPSGKQCSGDHTITDNKDLCVPPHMAETLNKALFMKLKVSNNKYPTQCPITCSAVQGAATVQKCQIVDGDIIVRKTCAPNDNFLAVTEIRGNVEVTSNCSLKWKEIFPNLKRIYATFGVALQIGVIGDFPVKPLMELQLESKIGLSLEIVTNKSVPYLDGVGLQNVFGYEKVLIGHLTFQNITENIGPAPKGVCTFSIPPAEIKKNCSKVTGDLVLDKTARNMTNLKEITGCLLMKNTNMTNYEFLSKIKVGKKCLWRKTSHVISDNLCIPYKVRRLFNDTSPLKKGVDDDSNKQGCYECATAPYDGKTCKVVVGDVYLTAGAGLRGLEDLEEVYGRVIITKSKLETISFPKLKLIDTDGAEGPAFEVTENEYLKTLDMPQLKKITSKEKTKVKITGNPKLEMGNLTKILEASSKESCSKDKGSVCQISAENDEPEKEEEESDSFTLYFALGLTGIVVLPLVMGTIALLLILKEIGVIRRKKDEEEEEDSEKSEMVSTVAESAMMATTETVKPEAKEKTEKTTTHEAEGQKDKKVQKKSDPLATTGTSQVGSVSQKQPVSDVGSSAAQ